MIPVLGLTHYQSYRIAKCTIRASHKHWLSMKSISLTFLRFMNERLVSKENVLLHQWGNETPKHGIKPVDTCQISTLKLYWTKLTFQALSLPHSECSKCQHHYQFQVEICPLWTDLQRFKLTRFQKDAWTTSTYKSATLCKIGCIYTPDDNVTVYFDSATGPACISTWAGCAAGVSSSTLS